MEADRLYSSTDLMDITGVTRKALRVLVRKGLIWPVRDTGNRRYDQVALDRLWLVTQLREIGLTLDQIGEILEVRCDPRLEAGPVAANLAEDLSEVVRLLGEKVESLLRIRKRLIESREQLFECSSCHEPLEKCRVCGEIGRLSPVSRTLLVPVNSNGVSQDADTVAAALDELN